MFDVTHPFLCPLLVRLPFGAIAAVAICGLLINHDPETSRKEHRT